LGQVIRFLPDSKGRGGLVHSVGVNLLSGPRGGGSGWEEPKTGGKRAGGGKTTAETRGGGGGVWWNR